MAEAVLFNLATAILNLAGSYTFSEIQLVRGARDELDSLKDTVETIRAVLLDAEKQQWHNHQVKLWLGRLKDVLYDAHDLLDDVATEDLRRKVMPSNKMSKSVRVFFSKSNQLAHSLKVGNEIQKLRKRLDRIANDKKFHLVQHLSEETMARGKKLEISTPDEQIIGRKKDKEKIKQLLLYSSSSDTVSFVSIVGKGGLGKTALARLVYNDREVEKHFDLKMWVCVSNVFDVNLIIKEILKLANYQDHEDRPLDQLQRLLHETLGKKKYLLVLDDMWNEDRLKWLALGDWLKGGKWGSKILVTTRSHTVAKVTNENSAIYDLEGLTTDESWNLFREVAFGERQASVDQRLEEMGRDIVRKCAGVPLAIRTIGSLLYGKKEDQWNCYRVKELPEIPEIDAVDNGIMQVLKFSYDHLPSRLKNCFAYCSLFPKDHIYEKEMMKNLWVAQGFIELRNGEDNLEEVADNYFSELTCRSFLDAVRKGNNGEVFQFKMHDLVHDLAQKVAGGECKIVNFKGGDNGGRIRHVSFISKIFSEEKMLSLLKTSKLRTFLYLKGESSILNSPKVFSKCRQVRVLSLCKMDIPLPPSSFGKLKQLRFLYILANQSIEILPESIMDLVNLQFLKLSECTNLKIFPKDLRKLVNLRYLSIHNCNSLSHLPPLSELPSLRTLSLNSLHALKFIRQTSDLEQSNIIHPFFPSLESLVLFNCKRLKWWERMKAYQKHQSQSSFPKLRSVEIRGCYALNFVPSFPQVEWLKINSMKMLEKQLLSNSNCPSEPVVGSTFIPFSKLKHLDFSGRGLVPSLLENLLLLASNLESMRLDGCNPWSLSRAMEHLSLRHIRRCEGLYLSCQEDDQGTEWQFLMKLRVLKISCIDCVVLPEWIRHAMTLQTLEISECKKLRSLPEWIGNFSLLKKLVLFNCPRLERLSSKIRNLTHLKELRIINCPNLEESFLTDAHVYTGRGHESERSA